MSQPDPSPTPPPAPQPTGAKGLAQVGLAYVAARGQLLQVEAKEAVGQVSGVASSGGIALFLLMLTWLLAVPAGVALAAEKFALRWEHMALIAAGIHLFLALIFLIIFRSRCRSLRPFEESVNQLREDRAWLAKNPLQK
jgi:uncharacterized membrane protein YqjE